ncbi:MAG: DUF1640 domain-containing protein [Methylococcaceae bacterium]|nr:MAG: DUF1640 domain-containing protein [Methylococcaceae bacterium]
MGDTHQSDTCNQPFSVSVLYGDGLFTAHCEALSESASYTLATKQDIHDVRMEIRDVRAEIERSKYDLIKWMAGLLLAQAAVVATLVKLL